MTETISAVEARKRFGELLNRVALLHEELIIERAGKPLARLSPVEPAPTKGSGRLDFRKAAGLGAGVDVDDYLRQERERWE